MTPQRPIVPSVYCALLAALCFVLTSGCGTEEAGPDDDATETDTQHESEVDTEPERACPNSAWVDEHGEQHHCLCVRRRDGGTDVACCAHNVPYECGESFFSDGTRMIHWSGGGGVCWGEGRPNINPRYANPCPWVDDPIN